MFLLFALTICTSLFEILDSWHSWLTVPPGVCFKPRYCTLPKRRTSHSGPRGKCSLHCAVSWPGPQDSARCPHPNPCRLLQGSALQTGAPGPARTWPLPPGTELPPSERKRFVFFLFVPYPTARWSAVHSRNIHHLCACLCVHVRGACGRCLSVRCRLMAVSCAVHMLLSHTGQPVVPGPSLAPSVRVLGFQPGPCFQAVGP